MATRGVSVGIIPLLGAPRQSGRDKQMEAMIIVASLLWLPSDTGQLISAVAARPAATATTITAATTTTTTNVAITESTEDTMDAMDTTTTTKAAKRKTSGAAQFSVQMILPFSKSTIRYSYTEPSGSATSARTPVHTADVDQAHSMSVSPYGCGGTAAEGGTGGQRKRKRLRWKTTTAAEEAGAAQTNTVMPLPGYPTNDRGRGVVFEAAAEQLDQLYTVSRVDAAAGSTVDDGEVSDEGGTTTDSDGTAKR